MIPVEDVSGVYKTVEKTCGALRRPQLLPGQSHSPVKNYVEGRPVVQHLLLQTNQVELVLNEISLHLAEILVARLVTEPGDPTNLLL